MYRFFLLLLIIGAAIAGLHFAWPWWTLALAAFVCAGLLPVWRRGGFWFAFLGAFLVWFVYTGYLHFEHEGRLTDRLAVTFGVGSGWLLVFITAAWGGVTAGLGGWFGASIRRTFFGYRARPQVRTDGQVDAASSDANL